MTHPPNHSKNFCTLLSAATGRTRERRLHLINTPLQRGGIRVAELVNRFNGLPCLCRAVRNVLGRALSAATAFWKRHFFMPPQQIPALATIQYPPSNFRGRSRRR